MTLQEAYDKIDGMKWKLGVVQGTLKVRKINGLNHVEHTANAAGKRTKEYQAIRAQLRDDYSTDLNESVHELGKIFAAVAGTESITSN